MRNVVGAVTVMLVLHALAPVAQRQAAAEQGHPPAILTESFGDLAAAPGVSGPSPSDRPSPPVAPVPDTAGAQLAPEEQEQAEDDSDQPRRLFDFPLLSRRRLAIYGWLDQGFTWNPDSPQDRFNGPVTFNDRANEYQLNQLYLIAERTTDTAEGGLDLGGRVDILYGTDHRFLMANGLEFETNADGSIEQTWNRDHRFYGLAMPQVYADLAWNDWVFRFGRFYTLVGYEVCTMPDNFFYSHSYTTQYAEPFTHTGMLATWNLSERLALKAGFHRGWDQWEDNNDKLGVLGGVTWTGPEKRTTLVASLISSNEQPTGESTRNLISLVWKQKLGERLQYVLQGDIAHEQNALPGGQDAEWYGLVNYLIYDFNPCWSMGFRYEWFSDDDGVRVAGLGYPKGIHLAAVPAHWQEVSFGVQYKPNANVLLRSEVRWDWVEPLVVVQDQPFDNFSDGSQFLWGTDLVIRF